MTTSTSTYLQNNRRAETTSFARKRLGTFLRQWVVMPYVVVGVCYAFFLSIERNASYLMSRSDLRSTCQLDWLYKIVIGGTIAEIAMHFCYLWSINSGRSLPFWALRVRLMGVSVFSFRPLSRLLFRHRWLNESLAVFLMACFIWEFLFGGRLVLGISVLLLLTFMLVDMWRVFYYNYWLFCCSAFLFVSVDCYPFSELCSSSSLNPAKTVQIVMASIYTYSGFYKLINRDFYTTTAVWSLEPILKPIYLTLYDKFGENVATFVCYVLAGGGVFFEFLAGIVLFVPEWAPWWLLGLVMDGLLIMHVYIIVGIGWRNNIRIFWSWNVWCALLVQYVFSKPPCYAYHQFGPEGALNIFGLHPYHLLTYAVMAVYPISLLMGYCPDGCMAHAYFAPNWTGHSSVLVPLSAATRVPKSINGTDILVCGPGTIEVAKVSRLVVDLCDEGRKRMLWRYLCKTPKSKPPQTDDSVLRKLLMENMCVIFEDWVDETFKLSSDDPFNENYGAGPVNFWECVAEEALMCPAIVLHTHQWNLLSLGYHDSVALVGFR